MPGYELLRGWGYKLGTLSDFLNGRQHVQPVLVKWLSAQSLGPDKPNPGLSSTTLPDTVFNE